MHERNLVYRTKRLVIRPLCIEDYPIWRKTHQEMLEPQNRWDIGPRKKSDLSAKVFRQILRSQKKQRRSDTFYHLGVFTKSRPQELIGMVSLMEVARRISYSAYLGYTIYNRHWGKGFGKEATLAALEIGFGVLGLHRIEAGIEPNNRRSLLLARSLGLRKEGLKKRAIFLYDQWIDLVMYSATSEEFGFPWHGFK